MRCMSAAACWPGSTRWIPRFRPTERRPGDRLIPQPVTANGARAVQAVPFPCGTAAGATGRQRPGAGRRAPGTIRTDAGTAPSAPPPAPGDRHAWAPARSADGVAPTAPGPLADRPVAVAGGPDGRDGGAGRAAPAAHLQRRPEAADHHLGDGQALAHLAGR